MRRLLFLAALPLVLATSCNRQKQPGTEAAPAAELPADQIHSLPVYTHTDSLAVGKHKVVYTITSQPDEELPLVVDEEGVKYTDQRFSLHVERDGRSLFDRSFTKADFRTMLPEEFLKYGIMDGMRYDRTEDGKIYFNTCVSLPQSDMSCPFLLTVGPDGSYTIAPDTTVDDEEMPSV